MPHLRISDAAAFLAVSDDTIRRWIDRGELDASTDDAGRKVVDGHQLAQLARRRSSTAADPSGVASSARNRFVGLVTGIEKDKVMAQVELACGDYRIVSLMSRDAADELGLEVGTPATAVVKATNVIVEV